MPPPDPRVTAAIDHMHRHLCERIDPAALAARASLSDSRFRHLFSAQTGTGPVHYLQRLRLRRARVLIDRTFLPLADVMKLVGYHDPRRFTRDFRRLHGMSPAALRTSSAATPLPAGGPRATPQGQRPAKTRHHRPDPEAKSRDPSPRYLM